MLWPVRFGSISGRGALDAASTAFDAATTAWVAAVFAVDGTVVSGPQTTLVDNLIVSLKTDGLFAKLDRLWLFAVENQTEALVDIITDSLATAVNTPTFAADVGFTMTGTTQYLDSGFNPTSGTPNYVQNSACFFGWIYGISAGINGAILDGSFAANEKMFPWYTDNNTYYSMNSAQKAFVSPQGAGLYAANRSGASQQDFYKNGSSVDTDTRASSALGNSTFFIGNTKSLSEQLNNPISCAGMGGSLSATDHANLYSRLRTYMTSKGVP